MKQRIGKSDCHSVWMDGRGENNGDDKIVGKVARALPEMASAKAPMGNR